MQFLTRESWRAKVALDFLLSYFYNCAKYSTKKMLNEGIKCTKT